MKTKTHAHSEIPAAPIPVISQLALVPTSVAMKNDAIAETQIRELAYKLYEERGRLDGSDVRDWLDAESILHERGKLAA